MRPAPLAVGLLLLLGGVGGCGRHEPVSVARGDARWTRVTSRQAEAAAAMGVPAVLDVQGLHFVFVPAGTLRRRVDGVETDVALDRGFFIQTAPVTRRQRARVLGAAEEGEGYVLGATHADAERLAARLTAEGAPWTFRLPTEAEWAYARPYVEGVREPGGAPPAGEWVLDHFGPLPSWTVSDPRGPPEGRAYVVRHGIGREAVPAEGAPSDVGFRFVIPLGCGLGAYGATDVTFRLFDELRPQREATIRGGYDLRVISMNDRLRARTMNRDAHWQRVPDPGSPVTLKMVPGAYYVYAERVHGKQILRGKEMKFYVKGEPVERLVPIPEADPSRYGSGVREPPR